MIGYRAGLPPLPARMRALPLSPKGYPVPFFVRVHNGQFDFQLADANKHRLCTERDLCWICGQQLGVFRTFVVGPIAALNRISSEPPSHLECAEYAVAACPFLMLPKAQRRDIDEAVPQIKPGTMLPHNPGVSVLYTTKTSKAMRGRQQFLFNLGEATTVRWVAEGRPATAAQALAGLESGLPAVLAMCRDDTERTYLDETVARFKKMLPRDET